MLSSMACTVHVVPLTTSLAATLVICGKAGLACLTLVCAIVLIACTVAEHVFLQFWELDNDHDFLISKDDLVRYGNHSLTYRIVERIFLQVSEFSACL